MVMLALALADVERGARLLVLDEPTASLPAADAERFLEAVKLAAQHDVGVLMVTHRLGEVLSLTSRVTVLRDGEVVHAGPTSECTEAGLIAEIVGPTAEARSVDVHRIHVSERFVPEQKAASGSGDALLEVTDLCGDIVDGVSLSVRPGELLGISGIVGSGVSELGRLIAGVSRPASGSVRVDGRELPAGFGPRQALKAGIAYVPGDRLNEGGVMSLTVRENLLLPNLRRYWMKRSLESSDFDEVVKALDVRPPDAARVFGTLSGGNQQKVIIGKWALLRPHVFVLDDPTAGVDPGAREEIYAVLRGLEQAGTGIVFISSEPEQLARLANRVLVVKEGRIVEQLEGDDVTEHAIGTRSL
jgi:ABC-type sugar transport system ATPase subunit